KIISLKKLLQIGLCNKATESYQLFGVNLPLISNSWDVEIIGEAHEFLGNFFMVLIGLHALAALIHHYVFKDNVLKSMLYFKK
ncbi:cytochrome b, partial [Acinetobacter haemolyticus]|uniref:cytochrome b n=1 Tax=Acinetobacter haemolyticus TaxID=29430 RepID=UPI00036D93F2